MILSVVVSLSHSVFILCEGRFGSQAHNIFIAAVTIHSMMDESSYWHSVSLYERFLKQWSSSILLWWKGMTFTCVTLPFTNCTILLWKQRKLFVCDNTHRACDPPKTFYGEGRKSFTCVAVTLTAWTILLWNEIISHWQLTVNLFVRNDVKLTQWTNRQRIFCWADMWWWKTLWFLWYQ